MKQDEGHRGGFSHRDPPLATGKRLSDEPGEGFGASVPAPPSLRGDVGTGCPWDTAICTTLLVPCLSLPWEERRGEPEEQISNCSR